VTPLNIIFLVLSSSNFKHDFIDETDKTTTLVDILQLRKRRYKLEFAYTESKNLHIKLSFVLLTFPTTVLQVNIKRGGGVSVAWELLNYI
jgi:hypothetical protein